MTDKNAIIDLLHEEQQERAKWVALLGTVTEESDKAEARQTIQALDRMIAETQERLAKTEQEEASPC